MWRDLGLNSRSPRSLANILPTGPMSRYVGRRKKLKYTVTGFYFGATFHVACFGHKLPAEAHPSPGLQLVWSQFSFFLTGYPTKFKEPSLLNYLPIAGGRILCFMPFPRVFALREMQTASTKIWTRVAISTPYGDDRYTKGVINLISLVFIEPC